MKERDGKWIRMKIGVLGRRESKEMKSERPVLRKDGEEEREGEKDIGRKRREWEWKRGRENGRGETGSGYFFSWKKGRE